MRMSAGEPIRAPLRAAIDAALDVGVVLGSLATWTIGLIVFYDVVLRYLDYPTLWSLEISTYLMIGAAVLASGRAVIDGGHFAVTLVPEALSTPLRRGLGLLINLACLGLMLFVCKGFIELITLSTRLGMRSATLLHVPLWIPQSVTLFGSWLMALGFLRHLIWPQD